MSDTAHRRRWPRVTRTTGQLLVGALGTAILIVGVVIGWRAKSASPVLVVGAVLVLAALVGDRWDEIRLRHRDTEATIKAARGVRDALGAVDQLAARATAQPEIEAEIAKVQESLASAGALLSTAVMGPARAYHTESDGFIMLHLIPAEETGAVFVEVYKEFSPAPIVRERLTPGPGAPVVIFPWDKPSEPGDYRAVWVRAYDGLPMAMDHVTIPAPRSAG